MRTRHPHPNRLSETIVLVLLLSTALPAAFAAPPIGAPENCARTFSQRFLAPLPDSREAAMAQLERLYPHLTRTELEAKLQASADSFLFFRSFVPLRFDLMKNSTKLRESLGSLLTEDKSGWAFGDVHPDNFGFVLDDAGTPIFTMNDFDDNAKAPLVVDLISFLSSVRTMDPAIKPEALIAAYRKGVADSPMEMPSAIEKMKKKAIDGGRRPKDSAFESTLGLIDKDTLKRVEGSRDLTSEERSAVYAAIERKYASLGAFKIKDAIFMKRGDGGSGELERFRVLIKTEEKNGTDQKHQIIELKRMVDAGLSPMAIGQPLSIQERIRNSLALAIGQSPSRLYAVDTVLSFDMFFRPRWDGNVGMAIAEVSKREQASALAFEAWTLGQRHRRSARQPTVYVDALGKIADPALIEASDEIVNGLEAYYKILKP